MELIEKDLSFNFINIVDGFIFDQTDAREPNYHDLDNMSKVDFIVELEDKLLFIEVKDPEYPEVSEENLQKFLTKLENGKLVNAFVNKYMDSFIYRWAEQKINKPIHYLSLVTLDSALLLNLTDKIISKLPPMELASARWGRPFIASCQVLNLETWNDNFPEWQVHRISAIGNEQ